MITGSKAKHWAPNSSRRIESDCKSLRSRYKPYSGQSQCDIERRRQPNRDKRWPNQNNNVGSSQTRRESESPKVGDYNLNLSILEMVDVLGEMGDKVKWPREMTSDPSKRSQ